jgi:hypothetical protein
MTAPNRAARHNIACLVIGLFLLRAVIPAGFMPDLAALRDGRIEVVLCTIDGLKTVAVYLANHTDKRDSSDKKSAAHNLCPFGSVTLQSLALPTAPAVLVQARATQSDVILPDHLSLLPPAQGPPLGSRAPPSSLL